MIMTGITAKYFIFRLGVLMEVSDCTVRKQVGQTYIMVQGCDFSVFFRKSVFFGHVKLNLVIRANSILFYFFRGGGEVAPTTSIAGLAELQL